MGGEENDENGKNIGVCGVCPRMSIFPANSDTLKKRLKDAEKFIVGASIDAPVPLEVKGEVFFDYNFT